MTFRRGVGGGGRGRFGGREDRGRPGARDGPPRGGDRPSCHTSDAATASARIFIGNLPTNDSRLTAEVLEENFSKFGQIMGKHIVRLFCGTRLCTVVVFLNGRHLHPERLRLHPVRRRGQRRECHSGIPEPRNPRSASR